MGAIWLWIAWSGLLSFIFGLMYWVGGRNLVEIAESHLPPDLLTSLYFSIVTFTTLGFGDVTPVTGLGKVVVTAEVILGYVMLGGLISILANKLARLA